MESLRPEDPRQVGTYRVRGRLGSGGMGHVYLGVSPGGRLVAVKVVRPELAGDPQFRRRFDREVRSARTVAGFYTAEVVDADPDADPPWLVTAYIPGPTLYQTVHQHGPLPGGAIGVLGAGLAEGLAAIHARGVVHRDLKPGNVILAEDGPRVIDFGIARAMDETQHTIDVSGTPPFMSPEQARDGEVGLASDVFSLGAVLVFAATGRSPFGTGQATAVMYRVVHEDPDLSGLTGLPDGLVRLIGDCLAKTPSDRPSVSDLLDQLTTPRGSDTKWLPPEVITMISDHRTAAVPFTRVEASSAPGESSPTPRSPGKGAFGWVLGAVAVVALLLWIGINAESNDPDPSTASPDSTATTGYDETSSVPTDGDEAASYSPEEEPTTTGFDPDSLDDASTDETPFTLDAMFPDEFTDDRDVLYNYEAGGTKDCAESFESDEVRHALSGNGCSEMLVGNYVSDDGELMVTAWVYPFADDDAAQAAYDQLDPLGFLDLGCWDPNSGPGAETCSGDVDSASQWQFIDHYHRYVIVTQSMYVNLTSDDSVDPWLQSAAREAVNVVGPQNYHE